MNRLVSHDLAQVKPARLPPLRRERRARVLFLHWPILGLRAQIQRIKHYAALHEDIDAVHIDLTRPNWMKIAGKSLPIHGGWDQHAYRYLWMNRLRIAAWLRGPLDARRFDVIHCMTPWVSWAPADQRRRRAHPRLAVQIDATGASQVRDFGHHPRATWPFRAVEQTILGRADAVISWSQWAARSAIDDCRVAPSRVHIIPPSIHITPAIAAREAGPCRIVFVGNDWIRKGGPLLLRIHQQSLAGRAELHIVSAGAPIDRGAKNVVWHGAVENGRLLKELLPSMDLFAMPTREDTFVWAILEAAAAGIPTVASNIGGISDIVIDGQTGLLVRRDDPAAFASALSTLVDDANLRRRMGDAAREHIRARFDPDCNYAIFLDLLTRMADQ